MSATVSTQPAGPEQREQRRVSRARSRTQTYLVLGLLGLVAVSGVRVFTGVNEIDSVGSIQAAIIATCPILMAGIGGLWSERAGIVNIGLEGQMILGTWGAAYFAYYYGPWQGIAGAALLGAVGGLLHALATVTFGVDHIVSGVAINIIGAGAAKFLAEAYFADLNSDRGTGGQKQLLVSDRPPKLTVPGVSDAATAIAGKHWFLVSDVAAAIAALTTGLSWVTVVVALLVVLTAVVLWRTSFGLRLRSCGENPQAAETLGVKVMRYKYVAVVVSGAMAGVGGGYLALVAAGGYVSGQTGGRGYIGLAAMIFGNWRPGGTLLGASMFGYTDSLPLRSTATIHALLLLVAIGLLAFAVVRLRAGRTRSAVVLAVFAVLFGLWFALTDSVPRDFASMTPYVATLLVLAFAAQRLRMPKADGQVYRKGSVS